MEEETLNASSPIDTESLAALQRYQTIRQDLAARLLDLEQERVRVLVLAQNFDKEANSMVAGLLKARGLPTDARVSVNFQSGCFESVALSLLKRCGLRERPQPHTDTGVQENPLASTPS